RAMAIRAATAPTDTRGGHRTAGLRLCATAVTAGLEASHGPKASTSVPDPATARVTVTCQPKFASILWIHPAPAGSGHLNPRVAATPNPQGSGPTPRAR